MNNFDKQLVTGKIGESEIARWLMSKGNNILPIYEVAKGQYKGPTVYSANGESIIAPDILAFSDKGIVWIEAKHKTGFTMHRKTDRWTTGIDLHHYFEYQKISKLIDWPVWLLFLHKGGQAKDSEVSPSGLFGNSLQYLVEHENHRWTKTKPHMVYWAIDALRELADYPLPDESNEEWLRDFDGR